MGYYTRVLTTEENCMSVGEIEKVLANEHLSARIEVEDGNEKNWTMQSLKPEQNG